MFVHVQGTNRWNNSHILRKYANKNPDFPLFLLPNLPQDGNVNVIANDIGDRITPAVLSVMHAEEILVGVPAKLNMVRNRTSTVMNNKQFFESKLSEEDFEEYSTNW